MSEGRRDGRVLPPAAFAGFFILFFTGLAPFALEFPIAGMEGSWIQASVYAGVHRLAYGTQFVFTNGPLFPLYHREYAGPDTMAYVAARLAVVVFLAFSFARLTPSSEGKGWLPLVLALVVLWPAVSFLPNDTFMLLIPLVTTLLVLRERAGWVILAIGIALAAAAGVAKVSLIPFSVGAFLLIDIAHVSRHKLPLSLTGYAVSVWAAFVISGQSPGQFWDFIVGSYEMTAGYSAALSLEGSVIELTAWLGISAAILVAVAVKGGEPPLIRLLRVALVAGFIFIALKAGFVRHDTHSFAAWGCTLFLLALLGLPGTLPNWRRRTSVLAFALPVVALLGILAYSFTSPVYLTAVTTRGAVDLAGQLRHVASFALAPSEWLAEQDRKYDEANASLRAGQPLPPVTGPVDALANMQSAVIAAGLDYSPRPTVQENMTYSPALIARNRTFLESANAPQTLFFAPGATDKRHPASIEGSLWPLLLARYDISGRAGDLLVLDRRDSPRNVELVERMRQQTGFGADISVPSDEPIFLKLDIRETLLGKLADTAFKPPQTDLVLSYADGTRETYRLIPGMISEGMVISPTVRTIDEYEALAHGEPSGPVPVTVRVETTGRWAYAPAITAIFEALQVPAD